MTVSEQRITEVLAEFENGQQKPEDILSVLLSKQPHLHAFIFGRPGMLLTPEEADLLTFAASVIWVAVDYADELIYAEELEELEELAWERLESTRSSNFYDKITPFFNQIDEEELLAFAEDTLAESDDVQLTSTGKEWIFITLAVMIEALS